MFDTEGNGHYGKKAISAFWDKAIAHLGLTAYPSLPGVAAAPGSARRSGLAAATRPRDLVSTQPVEPIDRRDG